MPSATTCWSSVYSGCFSLNSFSSVPAWIRPPWLASRRSIFGTASPAVTIIVGLSRAIFAAKGWDYYAHNAFFWAKLGTFLIIGLLSVPPTITYIKWRRANVEPIEDQIRATRRFLWIEVALFALLPIFAAAMARGYGEYDV